MEYAMQVLSGLSAAHSQDGDNLTPNIPIDKVYDLAALDDIRAGKTLVNVDEELNVATQAEGSGDKWDPASLLRSLGV